MNVEQLTAEFGIPDILAFETIGELAKAVVACEGVIGEFFLQGAQLTRWQRPGGRPVLFMSERSAFAPGKAIRGGIPVIFPWFGPYPSDPRLPQHGFARTAAWRLGAARHAPSEGVTLVLHLEPEPAAWQAASVRYAVTVGPRLRLELSVSNTGREDILFEEALHTYFAVSDVAQAAVSGLEGRGYIDKTDAMRRKEAPAAPLVLSAETDSVFLDTPDRLTLTDRGWGRRTVITKTGARSAIVWNPWQEKAAAMADLGGDAWRSMICVETGNVADNAVRLAPGATHTMTTTIEVGGIPEA
ncbi:MAG TPA: D-hexose-6-phosphate mutarotase [Stellaceae bacterium]|nr:D-hexose-6-phosphate mutarotase [Stellaceae bacterium]